MTVGPNVSTKLLTARRQPGGQRAFKGSVSFRRYVQHDLCDHDEAQHKAKDSPLIHKPHLPSGKWPTARLSTAHLSPDSSGGLLRGCLHSTHCAMFCQLIHTHPNRLLQDEVELPSLFFAGYFFLVYQLKHDKNVITLAHHPCIVSRKEQYRHAKHLFGRFTSCFMLNS